MKPLQLQYTFTTYADSTTIRLDITLGVFTLNPAESASKSLTIQLLQQISGTTSIYLSIFLFIRRRTFDCNIRSRLAEVHTRSRADAAHKRHRTNRDIGTPPVHTCALSERDACRRLAVGGSPPRCSAVVVGGWRLLRPSQHLCTQLLAAATV